MKGRKRIMFDREMVFLVELMTNRGVPDSEIKKNVDMPLWAIQRITVKFWNEKMNGHISK
jgi:hypothetical protein